MLERKYISRARLLQGVFATGALAACGGGTSNTPLVNPSPSPTPLSGTCAPLATIPGDRYGLNEVLSKPQFSHIDKRWLLDTFDPVPALEALHRPYFSQPCVQIQQGSTIYSIPSSGVCITAPGTYTLGGNITWSPGTATTVAAITIQASNVNLDLGGYTLTASGTSPGLQVSGITVNGPVDNITIKNGTLAAFTDHGILAQNVCGLAISNITVTGLSLSNLNVRYLTPSGILVSGSVNVAISGCTVTQANVTTDSCAGIQLLSTTLSTISGCTVSSLVNNDGSVQGFSYVGCSYITTESCTAQTFQSFFNGNVLTAGHTVIGFLPTFCNNLTFTNCSASAMTGCCDDCHGMSVFLCWLVTVQGFSASQILDGVNTSTHDQSGAKATGLEIYSLGGVKALDCTASNVRAINPEDLQAAGFSSWGTAIGFERCSASNVSVQNDKGVSDMRGIGFGWRPTRGPRSKILRHTWSATWTVPPTVATSLSIPGITSIQSGRGHRIRTVRPAISSSLCSR